MVGMEPLGDSLAPLEQQRQRHHDRVQVASQHRTVKAMSGRWQVIRASITDLAERVGTDNDSGEDER